MGPGARVPRQWTPGHVRLGRVAGGSTGHSPAPSAV